MSREENYGQFSTLRESKKGEKDIYRLHGQDEDGKNTQIIINLSNEPKSYIGHHPGQKFKNDPELNDIVQNDDLIAPPPLLSTIGPPGIPTGQTIGMPAPATMRPPPATTRPPPATARPPPTYGTTPPPIYYGSHSQAEPPQPPPQNPPVYTPDYEAPPRAPPAPPPQSYGVPQSPQAPPQTYAPPAAAPQAPSYVASPALSQNYAPPPAAPPQAPSYGVPQAPPQSYDPPAAAPPAPSYGVPQAPPQDPIVQTQTQFVMPALTLSWQQPVIQQDIPQDKPSYDAPSYGAPSNDPGIVQTQADPEGGLHYHIHVDDVNDVQQLDEVRRKLNQSYVFSNSSPCPKNLIKNQYEFSDIWWRR